MQGIRLQRKRTKGFRLISPNGLKNVCVTRPSKWSNPFKIGDKVPKEWLEKSFEFDNLVEWSSESHICSREDVLILYEKYLNSNNKLDINELKDKNLVCFCSLEQKCHADILLNRINRLFTT